MSEMQNPYDVGSGGEATGEVKTSGLAIASLVCSLVFCCPVTTVLGPVLGLIAIVSIGSKPNRRGKGLAVAAIVLGVLFTAVQAWGGYWYWDRIVKPMVEGPREAMTAAFAGDHQGFRDDCIGALANVSDDEIDAFVDDLRSRYGEFQSVQMSQQQGMMMSGGPGQTIFPVPYLFEFSNQSVPATVDVSPVDASGNFVGRMLFASITIEDPDLGNLVFPPATTSSTSDADGNAENGDAGDGG